MLLKLVQTQSLYSFYHEFIKPFWNDFFVSNAFGKWQRLLGSSRFAHLILVWKWNMHHVQIIIVNTRSPNILLKGIIS